MQKIQIPQFVRQTVKAVSNKTEPTCKIIGEYVVVNKGNFKNGNTKYTKCKIVQISPEGIYCDNDEFYKLDLF